MRPELAVVLMPAVATVVQWLVFLHLYRGTRVPFLWWWNLSWLCYTVWWGWMILAVLTPETSVWSAWLRTMIYLNGGLVAVVACASGFTLRHVETPRQVTRLVGGLGAAWVTLVAWQSVLPETRVGRLIMPLAVGGLYCLAAYLCWPSSSSAVKGSKLLASAQLLRGLHWMLGIVFAQSPAWNTAYISAGTLSHQLAIVGMIIVVLEYAKRQELALESRLAQAERLATLGELAAGVAHEIRNPLGAIVNAVHTLSGNLETLALADKALLAGVVQQEAARLNRLLTEVVHFAKPPCLRPTVGDVRAVLAETVALLRHEAQAAGITVCDTSPPVLPALAFDADQLRQALWNIAKNGLECMPPGQVLRFHAQAHAEAVLIRIQDTGPGIEAAEMTKIFRPFYSRKAGGTGLGLAIAERIVLAHHGRLSVESRLGHGTTMTLHLPLPEKGLPHGIDSRG